MKAIVGEYMAEMLRSAAIEPFSGARVSWLLATDLWEVTRMEDDLPVQVFGFPTEHGASLPPGSVILVYPVSSGSLNAEMLRDT